MPRRDIQLNMLTFRIGNCRLCGGLSHVTRRAETLSISSPDRPIERKAIEFLHDDCVRCQYNGPHLGRPLPDDPIELLFSFLTASSRERQIAADHLAGNFYHHDHRERLMIALLKMAQEDVDHRALMISLLGKIAAELSSATVTDLLLANTGTAFEQSLELIHNEQYEPDEAEIEKQIRRIEGYLIEHRAEWNDAKYQGMRDAHFALVVKIAKPIQPPMGVCQIHFCQPWPIAILNLRLADLAKRLGYRLDNWGSLHGEQRGFTLILPSGTWIRLSHALVEIEMRSGVKAVLDDIECTLEIGTEPSDDFEVDTALNEALASLHLSSDVVQSKHIQQTDCWT